MPRTVTVGPDQVSCSPFRVPAARLEAARAGLADGDTRWPMARTAVRSRGTGRR